MKSPHIFQLPEDLPPQTALALFDLLTSLNEALWQQYEPELLDLLIGDSDSYDDKQMKFDLYDDLSPF